MTQNHHWFGVGMLASGVGLAANTMLGPLVADAIRYPFTETVLNETLGLEAVSLLLVAPLAIAAGLLALRGHPAAPFVALGPTSYAAYMFVQYVLGPQYPTFQPSIALHLGLFVLNVVLLVQAWTLARDTVPGARSRGWAGVLLLLAGFVLSRWSVAFGGMAGGDAVPAAPADLTMYWSIFLLDLGLVVPAAVATAVGILLSSRWAQAALYGVVGWFALVPPSVAAMSIVKLLRDDPNAATGDTVVFVVVSLVFWAIAAVLFRPLFGRRHAARREALAAGAA